MVDDQGDRRTILGCLFRSDGSWNRHQKHGLNAAHHPGVSDPYATLRIEHEQHQAPP